jgi:hypothetical protein
MSSLVTICPHNRQLLKACKGQKVAVTVRDTGVAARAAADARAVGADLSCVIVEARLPLTRLKWDADLASVPLVVASPSFGAFRDLEPHIDVLKDLDIAIHLPTEGTGNMAGLRILSSLGIPCAAIIAREEQDWDAIADLATYAVLGPIPRAPIEPFTHMALSGEPFPFIDWDFPCFAGSRRFVRIHDGGALAASGARTRPAGPCRVCTGWTACRGRFAAAAAQGGCSSFFREMADIAQRRARQAGTRPCPASAKVPVVPSKTETTGKAQEGSAASWHGARGLPWIDLRGGPSQALMLSGILKEVMERHPGRRYNLVARTGLTPILMKHPAIENCGHPPKGARILTIEANITPDSQEGEYQRVAASVGLLAPFEECHWVPWEFEDERNLMALIPWKEKNVLICTAASGSPGKGSAIERWESLTAMLARDGMGVVQAGGREDPYVRGAYSILGLLTERQLISLPRHFDAVVTSDALMTQAARLCLTPVIVLKDPPEHQGEGGPADRDLSLATTPLSTIRRAVARAVKGRRG